MANSIASLIVQVKSKGISQTKRELKGLTTESKKTEKATMGLGKAFAALGVAMGAASIGKSIIGATVRQEQALAQLEQRLKSTGGAAGLTSQELQDMARAMQQVTTFGDEVVMEGQALLLTFTQIGKDVFPAATETMLNMSVAMNQGLKESAIQLGKALNDPIKGVTALRRVGVQLTEAQEEQIRAFVEMNDVAGAQRIILKELEVQMGGSARAARDTLGGAIDGLKNAFGDLLEGDSKGGGVRGATDAINDLTDLLSSEETKDAFGSITSLFFGITATIVEAVNMIGVLSKSIDDLIGKDLGRLAKKGLLPIPTIGSIGEYLGERYRGDGASSNSGLIDRSGARDPKAEAMARARELYGVGSGGNDASGTGSDAQDNLAKTTDLIFQHTDGLEKLTMQRERDRAEVLASIGTDAEKEKALMLIDDAYNAQRESIFETSDAYQELAQSARDAFEAEKEARDKAAEEWEEYKDGVKGVFSDIFNSAKSLGDIGDILGKRLLGNIADKASGEAASLFSGLVGKTGGAGGLLGKLGGLFFDKGGFIPSGSAGIVGEFGPELVRGPAAVTSRKETAKGMGNTFNISLPGVSNKKDAFEARGQIERAMVNAMNKASRYA